MSNLEQLLNILSTTPETKGKRFERYCKWFLENDPRYATQLKKVWLWEDWPDNWGRDKGIDLIAEAHNGKIWAIQVKNYDENYYITKDDIDRFLSESSRKIISFRLLIATTDRMGPNAKEVISAQEKQISLCLRNNLEASELDWMEVFADTKSRIKQDPKTPWPHQEIAISAVLEGFKTSPKGQLYMACGTGKTLVGLWIAKQLSSQNTLVLVPSISLVAQLYREWSENCGDFVFDPIFVCSDEAVSKGEGDDKYVDSAELGFPVTTIAEEIVKEYSSTTRPKVIFSTYHSSPVIAQACSFNASLNFDLVIADEAHHCAGKANTAFATITDKDVIRAQCKLYMTATPKIFAERVKQETQEIEYEIISMDDEEKFGPIFHKLLFSDAIKQDLLSDYQVIISVIDDETYREYAEKGRFVTFENYETDGRTLATQLLTAKAIKDLDLKKVISFHNRTKSAKDFIQTFSKALSLLPEDEKPTISYQSIIISDIPQSGRRKILKQFELCEEAALIANVKCLGEGVDVAALDGAIFVDPKNSKIDIIQAIGRVIRKSPNKKIGTIIIPVFVDGISEKENIDWDKPCFKPIWQVVRALREYDDMFAEELDNIRFELGKRTYKAPPKIGKISIDMPVSITQRFGTSIKIKFIESIAEHCAWVSLLKSHPEIAAEWHPTKNNSLKPNDIIAGSAKLIWWECKEDANHIWESKCYSRTTLNSGCPYCTNKKVDQSNCLSKTDPQLITMWHPSKNIGLTPNDVTRKSGKLVWWICPAANDHEWKANIANMTLASEKNSEFRGCPFCKGLKITLSNCLATVNAELANEWHPTRNNLLTPFDVYHGSHEKVWWKCPVAEDHEWKAQLKSRAYGNNCPMCRGSIIVNSNCLATKSPELIKQWHPIKNFPLTPYTIHFGSTKKITWQCSLDENHIWKVAACNRVNGSGCPFCTNSKVAESNCLANNYPSLVKEWDYTKNKDLSPFNVVAGSKKKVWWICQKDTTHSWDAEIRSRSIYKQGCPICLNKRVVLSNCLATLRPELAEEWHQLKNEKTPFDFVPGSMAKIWWICSINKNHEWQAMICDRAKKNSGCPHCLKEKRLRNKSKI